MFKYAFNFLAIIVFIYTIADLLNIETVKSIMIFFGAIAFLGLFS